MILIYEIIFQILFILFFPFLFLFPRIKNTIFSRLYLIKTDNKEGESIWFHGASAGDILSIKPVIDYFYVRYKGRFNIIVSANTESGRDVVKRYFPSDIKFFYMPFDIPRSIERFMNRIRPRILFIEAAEFWPVLINRAAKRNIRIVLLNGNIKREKLFFYKLLSMVSSNPFKKYELMIVRNQESADSAKSLGLDKEKIIICANTKYKNVFDMKNMTIPEGVVKRFGNIKNFIVFGSVHYEEEEMVLKAAVSLIEQLDDIRVVIAPRHLERTEPLIRKIAFFDSIKKITVSRFSKKGEDSRIILLDTIGDLFYIYSYARVAFVGGSLVDKGGHNILEPAVWGVPTITGKYVRNYEDMVRYLVGFGLIVVYEGENLADVILDIVNNPQKREDLSQRLLNKMLQIKSEFSDIEEIFNSRFSL